MELVIASSSLDSGISCFDINTGIEQFRYKSCTSPPHGLICVGGRFLASSQLRDPPAASGSILYWAWNKAAAEVKSFPAEAINPLVSNTAGTYIIGGGSRGDIYLWEVASGRLLKRWHAHYRAVTCLVLSEDDSLLVSGSEDGCVRVWSLLQVFNGQHSHWYSFSEHSLRVTDVVLGYGGCNALIISSSEDRTCKVWSMSNGKLLRTINFPAIIDAVALDPGEHVFYAGSRDGKIYIAALNSDRNPNSSYGLHIIGTLSEQSKAVTCLALSMDGYLLVSGSVDGTIRILDTRSRQIRRMLKHSKGPVNNVLVVCPSLYPNLSSVKMQASRKHVSLLPPPLDKYLDSRGDNVDDNNPITALQSPCKELVESQYLSCHVMNNQMKELQQQGSSAASETEMERLRLDCKKSLQMAQQWKKTYEELHQFCIDELIQSDQKKENLADIL